mgnify:CR=1 FL=1
MDILPAFAELGLSEKTLEALSKKGFEEPTEIQKACIPRLLQSGTEVVGQAQTGTGKTAAFALPIIETISEKSKNVEALILAPTRELALQVSEEINSLKGDRALEVAPIYGGASMENQLRKLKKGVQIVVGTPGRVLDHIRRGTLKLEKLEFMVLDEADEMLDMGFIEDIEEVLKAVPEEKRMLMFSATMPKEILKLAENFMKNPEIIKTKKASESTSQADQIYYEVKESDKVEALTRIIDRDPAFYGVVFCRTKLQCDEVAKKLSDRGYDAAALHGDLSQKERENILKRMKERRLSILIATDVAARGLDIQDLSHVINYSLPQDPEIYIHRVGRTGRAGKNGTAITFITPSEARKFSYIKRASKSDIRREEIPTASEVIESKKGRIIDALEAALNKEPAIDYYSLAETLLEDREPREAFASLLAYIYKDELDISQYKDINSDSRRGRGKEKSYSDSERPFDRVKKPSMDEEGLTRLFIARGSRDGITKRDLVQIIMDQTGTKNSDIHGVQVMEEFSFINAPYDVAEKILKIFDRKSKGGRSIVSRAKSESERREAKANSKPKKEKKVEEEFEEYRRERKEYTKRRSSAKGRDVKSKAKKNSKGSRRK